MISKSLFIRGLQCVKSLYLHKKRPYLRDPLSAETLAKFKRGHAVGDFAQELFPGGIDLRPSNPKAYKKNAEIVHKHIANKTPVMYEDPFIADDLMAIMDIVTFQNNQWNAYEVKSSLFISDTYFWDITFQAYVIEKFGIENINFHIIYVNENYVMEDDFDIEKYFKIVSVHDEIEKRKGLIEPLIDKMRVTTKLNSSPIIGVGQHCHSPYTCDFLGHCWKHVVEPSIFQIKDYPIEEKFKLLQQGKSALHSAIHHIYDQKQKKRALSILHKEVIVDVEEIKKYLGNCEGETLLFKVFYHYPAIPKHKYSRPYQPTPLMLIMGWMKDNSIDRFKHYFFEDDDEFWSKIEDFSSVLHGLSQTNQFVCYQDGEFVDLMGKDLQRIFQFNKLPEKVIDLKNIFDNTWYCAPKIDEKSSFSSVILHFSDEAHPELLKNLKMILKTEQDAVHLFQTPAGRQQLHNMGMLYLTYLTQIYVGLCRLVSAQKK